MNEEDLANLRMKPLEAATDLARRVEREHRAEQTQREAALEEISLAPYRVGSVPYFNAVPLTRGLENQIILATPSKLAEMLKRDELDAALVSITEALFNDRYDILDGIAVASLGEVISVFLAHRTPLENIREVFCDPASLTSVNLLRVLLAEQGWRPEFKTFTLLNPGSVPDSILLIGDQAIEFARAPHTHQIWDLGAAWLELTRLPFVYAIWALRRGVDNQRLRRVLGEAKDFGMDTLDYLINNRPEFDLNFRKDYLGWHIHYHLGNDEKRGINRFIELLRKHKLGPVHEPRYVL